MSALETLDEQRKWIWNGWSNNYVHAEEGYIVHAWDERAQNNGCRSLCGVRLQDSGLINLGEDRWEPGCIRCRRILRKRGLIE